MARDFDDSMAFEKVKATNTFRIFILGESAARGTPSQEFSFGRLLEAMLTDMYPGIKFEVHNAAMTAINSHVVLEIEKDCAQYAPDLFIVYMGNNEVVGPFGPGTVFTTTVPAEQMIRANMAVKSTRIGQLLESLMKSISARGPALKQWGGLAMFLDKQVRPDSPAMPSVYRNFENNLQDILRVARRAGASVIVSTVGANLRDCPPFASLHREDLSDSDLKRWNAIYQEGVDFEARDLFDQAIGKYLEAAALDDTYAEMQFRLGRCYWAAGDYAKAQLHYQLALQNDTLRFRADSRINDIIRATATGHTNEGIYFADGAAALAAESPHGITGTELFYEHVHLKFKGNYVLAKTIFPCVQRLLPANAEPHGAILAEKQVARRIAYTDYDEFTDLQTMFRDYLQKPPFTHQLDHDITMRKLQVELERLRGTLDLEKCLGQYDQAVRENPTDWRLRVAQYRLICAAKGEGDLQNRETLVRKIVSLHPYDRGYQLLGNLLLLEGRFDEAEAILKQSLFMNPVWAESYYSLAVLCLKRNDLDGAIRYLRQELDVAPARSTTAYRLLASQLDTAGKTDEAVRTLQQAIAIFPENQTDLLHCQLGELLGKQGQRQTALEHLETALRTNPELTNNETFKSQFRKLKGN
jgi:tetratricopeptide (TPR) repeat protein